MGGASKLPPRKTIAKATQTFGRVISVLAIVVVLGGFRLKAQVPNVIRHRGVLAVFPFQFLFCKLF